MKRFLLPFLAVGALALMAGCATKKDVSRQVTPVMNKLDDLDDRTAQTTRGIHDVDERASEASGSGWPRRRGGPEGDGRGASRLTRPKRWPQTRRRCPRPRRPGRQISNTTSDAVTGNRGAVWV